MGVCDPDKVKSDGIQGGPDLVAEVLSPGTAHNDRGRKRGCKKTAPHERGCKKTAPRQKRPLGKGWPLQIERKGRKKGAKEQAGGKTGRKRWGMMVS